MGGVETHLIVVAFFKVEARKTLLQPTKTLYAFGPTWNRTGQLNYTVL